MLAQAGDAVERAGARDRVAGDRTLAVELAVDGADVDVDALGALPGAKRVELGTAGQSLGDLQRTAAGVLVGLDRVARSHAQYPCRP